MLDRPQRHPPKLEPLKKTPGELEDMPIKTRRGRPAYYGFTGDREIWTAVEEEKARRGWSANKVCSQLHFDTFLGCFTGLPHHHTITGETVRRRYQRFMRALEQEAAQEQELRRLVPTLRGTSPLLDISRPLAAACQADLRARLADQNA